MTNRKPFKGFGESNKKKPKNNKNMESQLEHCYKIFESAHFYMNKTDGDKVSNIKTAIKLFKKTLRIYEDYNKHLEKAIVKTNLGSCYCDLVELYSGYSQVETSFSGHSFLDLEKKGKDIEIEKYSEKAFSYLEEALENLDINQTPYEWAICQLSLGTAYRSKYQMLILGDPQEYTQKNLISSIKCFQLALGILTKTKYPKGYIMTQMDLGNSYGDLFKIIPDITYYNLARDHYQKALYSAKKYGYPELSACIYNNLGDLEKDNNNFTQAKKYLESASQDLTEQNDWVDHLVSTRNLGNIAYDAKLWNVAITAYEKTINFIEKLRLSSQSDKRRQEIITFDLDVYEKLIITYINVKQLDKAFEALERCRSRYLVDLMASFELNQSEKIPSNLKLKLKEYEELQERIDGLRFRNSLDLDQKVSSYSPNEKIAELETEKQKVWNRIRELDPILAGEIQVSIPNISEIKKILNDSSTALINFFASENVFCVFILTKFQVYCHHFDTRERSFPSWGLYNWVTTYTKTELEEWKENLPYLLNEFSQKIDLNKLVNKYLDGINELIIIPHVYLHLIPFGAIPLNDNETLGDRFLIRYAPSCQILEFCANRPQLTENLTYGTVEDATEDLPCASFEGEQIAQLYEIPENLRLTGSEQATVKNYRHLMEQVQVLHSSHHAQSRLDNPLESSLKLADGYITLGQLLTPEWRMPNLSEVFLSCCETGLGITEVTDDILTLATGFLCAGARTVISTLWGVDDIATSIVSIIYHRNRQQGFNRPQALQQAQIELRTMTGEALTNTYRPQLEAILSEKLKHSDTNRRQIKKKRSQFSEEHPERKNLDIEYDKWNQLSRKISKTRRRLNSFCQEEYPFENPFYWAGFVCHGLR